MHWSLFGQDSPLANWEKRRFQHLESCTGDSLGKSPLLLMGRRKDVDSPIANVNAKGHLQHLEAYTGVWFGKTPPLLM